MDSPLILVVDDEPDNFDVIEALLSPQPYQLHYVSDGQQLLDRIDTFEPDLILLDVMMPGIDGIEVCRQLKQNSQWEGVPVLMVTALNSKEDLAQCLNAGADDFLSKPVSFIELTARVKSLLRTRQQYLQLVRRTQELSQVNQTLRLAEAEIIKALEGERALNELKSRFVSMTSHEFRTPLGVIASSAGILQDYGDRISPTQRQKHLKRIQSSVDHMTRLLEDVLTLSRVEAGKLSLQTQAIALKELLQTTIEDLNLLELTPRIKLSIDDSVPDVLELDARLLRQVLDNLLANALKYSDSDTLVYLTATYDQGHLCLTVRDQGIGIAPADQAHLFESFHRGENVSNIPGTGLGLAIVKKLIDLSGGAIECHSQLNQGTTFRVTLPMAVSSSPLEALTP